jgi:starch phosphorylase
MLPVKVAAKEGYWEREYNSREEKMTLTTRSGYMETVTERHNDKTEKIWSILEQNLGMDCESILRSMAFHLEYTLGKEKYTAFDYDFSRSVCLAVKDRLMERWNDTQTTYYLENAKRVYYLSLEYLMGRALTNSLINLNIFHETRNALNGIGYDTGEMQQFEPDAGLGNGGLGRLAACFLDSMATMQIPCYGYGIRYEYGIFRQDIVDGYQIEKPDIWLNGGSPWETLRKEIRFDVNFYGKVDSYPDESGRLLYRWHDTEKIHALAYDYPIPGYGNFTANTLRLWSARATNEFNLDYFNKEDYLDAVADKNETENITRVLYPRDDAYRGKELRLKQEYFFICATLQDIIRRHRVKNESLDNLADKAAIQLNDTHPALAVPELMRILIDQEGYDWEKAWDITTRAIGYTNHTVMPEAQERWPVDMLGTLLPRHLQIIYEINRRFLEEVEKAYPGDIERLKRMSIIQEEPVKSLRMTHLAVVGSHSVNGVAELHTSILTSKLFRDFYEMYPEKFNNKTNGITQRRWLKVCNPELSALITENIGDAWVTDMYRLRGLTGLADDPDFQEKWMSVKKRNKKRLAQYIQKNLGIRVNVDSMFVCQVKRIHEYKRQLLNILRVIADYNRLKSNTLVPFVPKTFIFAGKAAPGYFMAKLIIKLINSVAGVINSDPEVADRLKVVFLPNYGVSLGEIIFPAADVSEQISTAGMEASGTGNMKFALNGAITVGTLDGANIEILEEVGRENMIIFGLTAEEVEQAKKQGYDPREVYLSNPEIRLCLDQIKEGYFSGGDECLFAPIVDSLLDGGDYYMILKDFDAYLKAHERLDEIWNDAALWARISILNTANMGKFSSDRTIAEYANEIWDVKPTPVHMKVRKPGKLAPNCPLPLSA